MTESNFADKYRPERFREVFGQESVVTCLSSLIQRGQVGRHILLHGSVGSGKTSLAQLYARALNCDDPDDDGSPCLERCVSCRPCDTPRIDGWPCGDCKPCKRRNGQEIAGFFKYNVSKDGGGREAVAKWTEGRARTPSDCRYQILFFDEAQALTPQACDALLDSVERPAERVLFFFATTEVERIREALRSRLFDLLVRPLPASAAVAFLRNYAEMEGVAYEPGSLELLAGLRKGYPRDLLLGLDRVYDRDSSRLTIQQVRDAFDVDQTEILVAYFQAPADGDLARQTEVVFGWREGAADRIRWIQAFLTSLYHNNILYRRLVVDGLIEAIPESARTPILDRFCSRLGLTRHAELEPAWLRMMEFWPIQAAEADETALNLRLTLFHRKVNDGLDGASDESVRGLPIPVTPQAQPRRSVPTVAASSGFGPPPAFPACPHAAEAPGFLTAADVRRIINSASFLIQEHGIVLNVACEVRPERFGVKNQAAVIALIAAFRDELARQIVEWGGGLFASLTLIERDGHSLVGRVVAHVPRPSATSPTDVDCVARAGAWARTWRREGENGDGAVKIEVAPAEGSAALAFHWTSALGLCAGLDPDLQVWDPGSKSCRPLRKLLRIKSGRGVGPIIGHTLVSASGLLSDSAVAEACRNRLEPLSAYDDRAWTRITSGWERDEFEERRRTREERDTEIAAIHQTPGLEGSEFRAALEERLDRWPTDPRARRRRWRGWWGRE